MLLSEQLHLMNECQVSIRNERPFDYLSLLVPVEGFAMLSYLDDAGHVKDIPGNLTMLLTTNELALSLSTDTFGLAITSNPRELFFRLHNFLCSQDGYRRPEFASRIDPTAMVSAKAHVAEANVVIGAGVVLEPFVMIYPDTVIGDYSVIRAGTILGGVGFEFKRTGDEVMSVSHAGGVIIEDHVEIQNNACIDRAIYPWDDTRISSYSKLDNHVYVAHGCKIGKRALITAHSVVGGRVVVGDDVWIGFNATIRNGLKIGDRARVNMGAVVTRSVGNDESVTGNFAIPHDQFLKLLKRDLKSLEQD
ncbi:MAG TPA: DapH/DapD/GlmU-related protein [Bacillota bacterium]|nr:UDP-3-O-(3-hydroxymyristoyl)glucosamine N-acyltransferase [Fastidiosipila sp.]HPX93832.1 DapH/DapD/GlmU-related protein [Bacillota bacterium]HQB81698.1 DapH/DapD/GlmU-related protein [Bacillota bacterium]